MHKLYLPDWHDFEHIAIVPWPHPECLQQDWVFGVECLEQWLNRYVGSHWVEWAWATRADHEYWQACVAFRQARMKTLCLLTWT